MANDLLFQKISVGKGGELACSPWIQLLECKERIDEVDKAQGFTCVR